MSDTPSSEQTNSTTFEQDGISLTRRAGVPVLANFRLLQKLGEGGMGYVYKAEDVVIQKPVALKILHKHYAEKPEFLARFHQEARAAGKLNHPNIVSAVSTGEANGHFYYVMEYCEGEPLDRWLTREKIMPWRQALEVASQVAQGLEHAHEHGIVHRDIKPANIMLTPEGKAKILDFGLAKDVMSLDDVSTEQRGVAWGTPNYISPEQGRNEKTIGPAADTYSLGATLFHLVTGQTPFKGTGRELIKKHLTQNIPDPRSVKPDLPPAMTCLLVNMMAKSPGQRYADCGQLGAAIRLTLGGRLPTFAAVREEKVRPSRPPAKPPAEPAANQGEPQSTPRSSSEGASPASAPVAVSAGRDDARRPLWRTPAAWVALPLLLALIVGLSYWALARRDVQVEVSPSAKAEPDPAVKQALEEAARMKRAADEATKRASEAEARARLARAEAKRGAVPVQGTPSQPTPLTDAQVARLAFERGLQAAMAAQRKGAWPEIIAALEKPLESLGDQQHPNRRYAESLLASARGEMEKEAAVAADLQKAQALLDEGKYGEAENAFKALGAKSLSYARRTEVSKGLADVRGHLQAQQAAVQAQRAAVEEVEAEEKYNKALGLLRQKLAAARTELKVQEDRKQAVLQRLKAGTKSSSSSSSKMSDELRDRFSDVSKANDNVRKFEASQARLESYYKSWGDTRIRQKNNPESSYLPTALQTARRNVLTEAEIILAAAGPEPAAPATPVKPAAQKRMLFVLKDGRSIKVTMSMDLGEEYTIKDEKGDLTNIRKADVAEIKNIEGETPAATPANP